MLQVAQGRTVVPHTLEVTCVIDRLRRRSIMKVVILGNGVIGVTTAYYLAKQGHEVTVVDRQAEAGLETSFANAGQVSPGYSAPWAAPGIPLKAIKWMFSKHSPLVVRPNLDPNMWKWVFQMLRNCTADRYSINKERMLRLADYSREAFNELRAEIGIQYDQRTQGTLQVFRTQKQLDAVQKDIAILKECNIPHQLLDVAGCIEAEPGLAPMRNKIVGGLRLPLDETGDCFLFTQALAKEAEKLGVKFQYNTTIHHLYTRDDRIIGVNTDKGMLKADSYVVAMGSYSPLFLRKININIPVYPVKGYSLTLPITDERYAPVSTIMDETHKVALTRLGDRIRVAGTAELTGYDLSLRKKQLATIAHVVTDLFPQGGDIQQAEPWTGLRPMTPDGTPIVGETAYRNLYLNTGHGTLGWTMSCGSGRLLADVISKRQPDIDPTGLDLARYDTHKEKKCAHNTAGQGIPAV